MKNLLAGAVLLGIGALTVNGLINQAREEGYRQGMREDAASIAAFARKLDPTLFKDELSRQTVFNILDHRVH